MTEPEEKGAEPRDLPSLERGRDLSRILAFTDGVFAIAITLLVLQIEVPEGMTSNSDFLEQLDDLWPDLFAFAISFVVIGGYWIRQHRLMRMVREYDRGLMGATMLYLFWIVLLPFSSQLIGEYAGPVSLSVVFYILNLTLIGMAQTLMVWIILKHDLGDEDYRWDLELTVRSSLFTACVFLVTAPIGIWLGGWTPLLWVLLLRLDPWERKRTAVYKAAGRKPASGS